MNDGDDTLMYSPLESDDIHIDMQCESRGKLVIVAYNPVDRGRKLLLVSGNESGAFRAKGIPGDGELLAVDEYSSEIVVSVTNHVLAAFRLSGQLSQGDPPDLMNAKTPEELATIEKFFADCEGESS